jgi:hypothetical protein
MVHNDQDNRHVVDSNLSRNIHGQPTNLIVHQQYPLPLFASLNSTLTILVNC